MKAYRLTALASFLLVILSACQPASTSLWGAAPLSPTPAPPTVASGSGPLLNPTDTTIPTITPLPLPEIGTVSPLNIWIHPAGPPSLRNIALGWGLPTALDLQSAAVVLDLSESSDSKIRWIYALVAPFPTVTDGVTSRELEDAWSASPSGSFAGLPLWMDESTLAALTALWGEPAPNAVRTAPAGQLLETAWQNMPSWAIIPFEDIEPRWKVLTVNGQSPIHNDFDAASYALVLNFNFFTTLQSSSHTFELPRTNRDETKLTTLILTGVTAMTRATAATMDAKGILYPGEDIRDLMRGADITHINNEVPFYAGCPDPDPNQQKEIFCSAPRYMELLLDMGMDVVELSGDHFADYERQGMLETLQIYKDNNIPYYGGGYNITDGKKPLLMEVNGNKFMFIACNIKDIYARASDTDPGAVTCDFPYMTEQIRRYREQGYLPIATYQYHEFSTPEARPQQEEDFRILAEAGAVIVSGSQAHVAQVMEFYNGSFIHYGLGNLFFDQMQRVGGSKTTRREFIDRHVFYDGKYLGVELFTTYLEDFARPRFMTPEERASFLTNYFEASGWLK